jgi:hypothetical protein
MVALLLTWAWLTHAPTDDVATRIRPPAGARRVEVAPHSFGAFLRALPLYPPGTRVHLYDGREKARQDVHEAVVDLDVGARDLQQCADAVMRLYAEWSWAERRPVAFHPDPGKPRELRFAGGDRRAFEKFLVQVMADAGTASLAAELRPTTLAELAPGDVLIQGGYPGHAVLVVDVAVRPDGTRLLLLGQSYMPAQQFHILKNLAAPSLSPWYDASTLSTGLQTPEWRPFTTRDLRRF